MKEGEACEIDESTRPALTLAAKLLGVEGDMLEKAMVSKMMAVRVWTWAGHTFSVLLALLMLVLGGGIGVVAILADVVDDIATVHLLCSGATVRSVVEVKMARIARIGTQRISITWQNTTIFIMLFQRNCNG